MSSFQSEIAALDAAGAQARQVVHDGVAAAGACSRLRGSWSSTVLKCRRLVGRQRLDDEALHEDAVEAVLLHPAKVAQDRLPRCAS